MSPFDPWLATYPAGTVAERPWWTLEVVTGEPVQTSYPPRYVWQTVREDGRVGIRLGYANERSASRLVTAEVVAALDSVDDAHPRPVPPILPSQVWAFYGGTSLRMIVDVVHQPDGVTLYRCADSHDKSFLPVTMFDPNAVLVSGPHAPWAPKGWRP